jgi:hypothetical protein
MDCDCRNCRKVEQTILIVLRALPSPKGAGESVGEDARLIWNPTLEDLTCLKKDRWTDMDGRTFDVGSRVEFWPDARARSWVAPVVGVDNGKQLLLVGDPARPVAVAFRHVSKHLRVVGPLAHNGKKTRIMGHQHAGYEETWCDACLKEGKRTYALYLGGAALCEKHETARRGHKPGGGYA